MSLIILQYIISHRTAWCCCVCIISDFLYNQITAELSSRSRLWSQYIYREPAILTMNKPNTCNIFYNMCDSFKVLDYSFCTEPTESQCSYLNLMVRLFRFVRWFRFILKTHLYNNFFLNITFTFCVYPVYSTISLCLFLSFCLPQSQGSPYSMSGQRNVRALWANCKGEGRQNQVCVSQPVWYIQRKEPWNTKACWWVPWLCRPHFHCHDLHAV